LSLIACSAAALAAAPQTPQPASTNNIAVTVNYTGKGVVDASHGIYVFLFTSPDLSPQSQPVGPPQVVQKNGATVTFLNVAASPVYIAAFYNETGAYQGGPPPPGAPIAQFRRDPKGPPTPVTPGPKTMVRLSFNDAQRWK
jgi:hypothetical protein